MPILKANVNLVLVGATVVDRDDKPISGLQRSNFAILENKVPQSIRYFSEEESPLSAVLVFDTSGSMAGKIDFARSAANELLRNSNPHDEIAIVSVAEKPRVKNTFGDSLDQLQETIESAQAVGTTSLWDSVCAAIEKVRAANMPRKALVIISDGGDNASRATESAVRRVLQETDVQVYAIGIFESFPRTQEAKRGPVWLKDLTAATGGQLLIVNDHNSAVAAGSKISAELRSQYVLGYYPQLREANGKWRSLKIKVQSAEVDRLHLYARKGYYSPTD